MNTLFFDDNNNPSQELLRVLELTNIDHDGTLAGIVSATQGAWFKSGKFRFEISDEDREMITPELMECFQKLEMVHDRFSSKDEYDYVLLLGATITAVRKRLAFLLKCMSVSLKANNVVMLGSGRKLDPQRESFEMLTNPENGILAFKEGWFLEGDAPRTEAEMMKMVVEQSDLPSDLEFVFIAHTGERANTGQTVEMWLEQESPAVGSVLAVSSNPFVGYQAQSVANSLPQGFGIEGCGYASIAAYGLHVYLDNLAKFLYELNKA